MKSPHPSSRIGRDSQSRPGRLPVSMYRQIVTAIVLTASLAAFTAAGPIAISDYSGPKFPYSASFHTLSEVTGDGSTVGRYGYWLNSGENRSITHFRGDPSSSKSYYYETVSKADPNIVYQAGPPSFRVIRFNGTNWNQIGEIPMRAPISNQFHSFVTVISDRNGADIVFFRPASDSLAVILDTDGDLIADKILDRNGDTFDDEIRFGEFLIAGISDSGTLYGVTNDSRTLPNNFRVVIHTIFDTNEDLIPDTPAWPADSRGRVEFLAVPGGMGMTSVESGTGRLVVSSANLPSAVALDGNGFPIPGSYRQLWNSVPSPGSRASNGTSDPQTLLHDGSMASYWTHFDDYQIPTDSDHGIYVLDDVNFDGVFTFTGDSTSELFPALTEKMFNPTERPGIPSVPELTELRSFAGGSQSVTFADFGIWPNGHAFSFRQARVERSSVTVSLDGLLSFAGPISASPSLATLDATPGLVAPAWSDQWDTSQVRVYAGCAPVQRRFADGSGSAALSFVIEWRGLISPNGKRTNLRCLLLEDGSFRVDYGAMEIGEMPIVVGYSTDGAGAIVSDDLSDNSWGGQPAGTLDEAKLGEEFGATKPFDLAHKWVRFAGYGDVRGPRPELIGVVLKKGNKIQMRATGSNVQPGATLVVDGVETFELSKSATGSKWVVTKKAVSTPGVRSVASIWGDGQPHTIVVVNPDGGHSDLLTLQ